MNTPNEDQIEPTAAEEVGAEAAQAGDNLTGEGASASSPKAPTAEPCAPAAEPAKRVIYRTVHRSSEDIDETIEEDILLAPPRTSHPRPVG